MDKVLKLMVSAIKQGFFLEVEGKMTAPARKWGVFLAMKAENKKETPPKECLRNKHIIARRFSAASSASARCSKNIEAAGTPDPSKASGRYSPERGCHEVTGVEIVAKKKPGDEPGEFFACYKRNKFIC